MISTTQAAIQQVGTFLIALLTIGGSIYLTAAGHDVPQWLIGFDGAAIAFVYGNAQSFVQARTALPTHLALQSSQATVHQLATGGTLNVSTLPSGTTVHTGGNEVAK